MAFKLSDLRGDLLIVLSGQVIICIFGVVQSFLIPKILSIDEFGYWQLFLLYSSYIGFLHLGYLDGILLRWTGKNRDEINKEANLSFAFLVYEQIIIVVPLIFLSNFFLSYQFNIIIIFTLIYGIITNFFYYFIYLYIATKNFKAVSINNTSKIFIFLVLLIILLYLNIFNYYLVICAYILAIFFCFLLNFKDNRIILTLDFKNLSINSLINYGKENIVSGFFITISSYEAIFITSIDKLLVGLLFPISQFAYYTFAVSMLAIIYMFILAISQVFFPYLYQSIESERTLIYFKIKKILLLLWAGGLIIYFPLCEFIPFYFPNYVNSLSLFKLLLISLSFNSINLILHVNFYKIFYSQKAFFISGLISGSFSIIIILLVIKCGANLSYVAMISIVCSFFWYVINELFFKRIINISYLNIFTGLFIIGIYTLIFLISSSITSFYVYNILLYLILFLFFSCIIFKSEIRCHIADIRRAIFHE